MQPLPIPTPPPRAYNGKMPGFCYTIPYTGNSNGAITLNRMFIFPFVFDTPVNIDAVLIANVGVASSFVRFGIYEDAGGLPDRCLADSGQLDASVGGVPVYWYRTWRCEGVVWVSCVGQGVAPSMTRQTNVIPHPLIGVTNPNAIATGCSYYVDSISGALPARWGTNFTSHASGSANPVIYLRAK